MWLHYLTDLRITTAPNNIQVSEGSTARLPCVVSGDNVNIGWSRYLLAWSSRSIYPVSIDSMDWSQEPAQHEATLSVWFQSKTKKHYLNLNGHMWTFMCMNWHSNTQLRKKHLIVMSYYFETVAIWAQCVRKATQVILI